MASQIPDRYIWLGLGVFMIGAAYAVRYAMRDINELTALPDDWDREEEPAKGKEPSDELSVETLRALVTHHNPNIANSAISIVLQRFAALPNISEEMYEEYNSSDPVVRHRARTIMKFLENYPLPPEMDRILPIRPADADAVMDSLRRSQSPSPFVYNASGNDSVPQHVREHGSQVPGLTEEMMEARNRRIRREAVVLHEGDGEIVEDDIYRGNEDGEHAGSDGLDY
ncbi:hypothetical protein MBLNU230_g4736t1 [Neophaeotheca triangularis]